MINHVLIFIPKIFVLFCKISRPFFNRQFLRDIIQDLWRLDYTSPKKDNKTSIVYPLQTFQWIIPCSQKLSHASNTLYFFLHHPFPFPLIKHHLKSYDFGWIWENILGLLLSKTGAQQKMSRVCKGKSVGGKTVAAIIEIAMKKVLQNGITSLIRTSFLIMVVWIKMIPTNS